jgi:hypothetical protein
LPASGCRTLYPCLLYQADLFIVRLRAVEHGYGSGSTCCFNARAEGACNEWVHLLRTEADRAMIKDAQRILVRKRLAREAALR